MRKLLVLTLALAMFSQVYAQTQSIEALITEGKRLQSIYKEKEALDKFEAALLKDPNNVEALHHASILLSKEGERQSSKEAKKPYFEKARNYSLKAIKLNEKEPEAHFTHAVALGRLSLLADSEEKLKNAKVIKQEAERTIQLNPRHAGAHHILGRLNREIANMSPIKVMAAKALYDGVPEGCTFEKAATYFQKAIELDPNYILYYYDAALNYEYWNKQDQAVSVLEKAIKLPLKTPDDPYRMNDCKKLLSKYKS